MIEPMTVERLARHVHSMKVACLVEMRPWDPDQHTIFLSQEEWREVMADPEITQQTALDLLSKLRVFGVRVLPVEKLPDPLR